MSMSRWKMMAGVLGVSIGGLAAAASQCPKLDKTKGRQPETPVSVAEAPKVPPAGAASAPPAPPSLPLPATTPAPLTPAPTPPALPSLPTAEIPAPPPMKTAPLPAVPAFPDVPTLPAPTPAKPEPTKLPEPPVVTFPALPSTPTTPDTKPGDLQLPPSRLPVDPPMTTPAKPPVTDLVPPEKVKPAEKPVLVAPPGNPQIDFTPSLPSVPTEVKPIEKPMPAGGIFSKPNTTQPPATGVNSIAQTGSTVPAQPPTTGVIAAPGLTLPQGTETTAVVPAGTKFRILLSVGDGMPMFEVKDGDNLVLKVVCEKVDIKSPEKGQGLSAVTARGKVRFAGFGAEGTCEELSFLAGTGEVSMSGEVKVQVKDKLGRVESEISSSTLKYKIDSNAVGGTLKP